MKKRKKKKNKKCTLCSKLYKKFETNVWRIDAVIDGKAPRKNKINLRNKSNVICLRYIFYYLQRIKSIC